MNEWHVQDLKVGQVGDARRDDSRKKIVTQVQSLEQSVVPAQRGADAIRNGARQITRIQEQGRGHRRNAAVVEVACPEGSVHAIIDFAATHEWILGQVEGKREHEAGAQAHSRCHRCQLVVKVLNGNNNNCGRAVVCLANEKFKR